MLPTNPTLFDVFPSHVRTHLTTYVDDRSSQLRKALRDLIPALRKLGMTCRFPARTIEDPPDISNDHFLHAAVCLVGVLHEFCTCRNRSARARVVCNSIAQFRKNTHNFVFACGARRPCRNLK